MHINHFVDLCAFVCCRCLLCTHIFVFRFDLMFYLFHFYLRFVFVVWFFYFHCALFQIVICYFVLNNKQNKKTIGFTTEKFT